MDKSIQVVLVIFLSTVGLSVGSLFFTSGKSMLNDVQEWKEERLVKRIERLNKRLKITIAKREIMSGKK